MPLNWQQIGQNLSQLPTNPLFNLGLGMMATPYQRTPVSFGQVLANGVGQMDYAAQMAAKQRQAQQQAQLLGLKLQGAQAQQKAQAAQAAAQQNYANTLTGSDRARYAADPDAFLKTADAPQKSPWALDPKSGMLVNASSGQIKLPTVAGVAVPAGVPRVGQPSNALAGLPAETQAYVTKVMSALGGAQAFGPDGQPTPQLKDAVQRVETGNDPNQTSTAGAQGPMQFMPATAASVGVTNPFDPAQARAGAGRYLAQLYRQFGNPQLAVAAYNAGPGAVARAVSAPQLPPMNPVLSRYLAAHGSAQRAYATLTPAQVQAAGLPNGSVVQRAPNGQLHMIQKGSDFQGGVSQLPGDSTLSGDAYLQSVPANVRTMAEAFATNRQPIPTGTALKNPLVQQAVLAAQHANPALNAGSYASALKTREAFTSGKQSQIVNRMNTALGHLQQYVDLATQMNEGSSPLINGAHNAFDTHVVANKTLNDLRTVIPNLSSEVSYVYSGGVPAEGEVNAREKSLNPNLGKAAMISAARTQLGLLKSKLEAMQDQYQQGIGPMGKPLTFINKDAQAAIDKINVLDAQLDGSGAPAATGAQPAPQAGGTSYAHLWGGN